MCPPWSWWICGVCGLQSTGPGDVLGLVRPVSEKNRGKRLSRDQHGEQKDVENIAGPGPSGKEGPAGQEPGPWQVGSAGTAKQWGATSTAGQRRTAGTSRPEPMDATGPVRQEQRRGQELRQEGPGESAGQELELAWVPQMVRLHLP